MNHELLNAWSELDPKRPPYILPGDEALLPYGKVHTEETLIRSGLYLDDLSEFQFGLVPVPYFGPILSASVYILMLNPGFLTLDLYAETYSPEYRKELLNQLSGNRPNVYFNSQFYWVGGFHYWLRKFKTIIDQVAHEMNIMPVDALRFVSEQIAFLELVPYHSARFALPNPIMRKLRSVTLMKGFVEDVVKRRAQNGEATIVVTRKARDWNLQEKEGIVVYSAKEARGAHISTKTRGGTQIISRLREHYLPFKPSPNS